MSQRDKHQQCAAYFEAAVDKGLVKVEDETFAAFVLWVQLRQQRLWLTILQMHKDNGSAVLAVPQGAITTHGSNGDAHTAVENETILLVVYLIGNVGFCIRERVRTANAERGADTDPSGPAPGQRPR